MDAHDAGSVAVLFSGGDAPGMNALLRAFVRLGLNRYKRPVLAVKDGYAGLVRTCKRIDEGRLSVAGLKAELADHPGWSGLHRRDQDLVLMDPLSVSGILGTGGIILGCARCDQFRDPFVRREVIDLLADLGIEALVVCGGEGSLAGAARLAEECDLQVVGLPATIDNDVPATELALGVDTAMNTLTWAVEHFNDTASSHHRIMVLETMGRRKGELARRAALAAGAEIVVTPERGPLDQSRMQGIVDRLGKSLLAGRRHAIVLVAEGVEVDPPGPLRAAEALARHLEAHFQNDDGPLRGLETRLTVLGYLQRGGKPTAADRILAARFAEKAWEMIADDSRRSGVVGLESGGVVSQHLTLKSDPQQTCAAQRLYELHKALSK